MSIHNFCQKCQNILPHFQPNRNSIKAVRLLLPTSHTQFHLIRFQVLFPIGNFLFIINPEFLNICSTGSQFVIYSSSARTSRVCPCHLIINLKFTFYEHLEYIFTAPFNTLLTFDKTSRIISCTCSNVFVACTP